MHEAMTADLPAADAMTPQERLWELESWADQTIVKTNYVDMQLRFGALLGRDIWTTEMFDMPRLIAEAKQRFAL